MNDSNDYNEDLLIELDTLLDMIKTTVENFQSEENFSATIRKEVSFNSLFYNLIFEYLIFLKILIKSFLILIFL